MLIRYGYEITINCPQPTAMVCLLSVSEDRKADAPAMPGGGGGMGGMGGMDY